MDFFYPNFINDFWRIMGLLFYADRLHFVVEGEKRFDREAIITFSEGEGVAFYDTARRVRRLKGNASDAFLEVVEPTDLTALLAEVPHCHRIVTTGGNLVMKVTNDLTAHAAVLSHGGATLDAQNVKLNADLTADKNLTITATKNIFTKEGTNLST